MVLRRKSVRTEARVWEWKKECRDWRVDQKK